MEEELGHSKYDFLNRKQITDNSRNSHNSKTLDTSYGDMELDVPRDRNGELEPKIIKKYKHFPPGHGVKNHLHVCQRNDNRRYWEPYARALCGDFSDSSISRITDKILPIVKE